MHFYAPVHLMGLLIGWSILEKREVGGRRMMKNIWIKTESNLILDRFSIRLTMNDYYYVFLNLLVTHSNRYVVNNKNKKLVTCVKMM